MKEILKRCLEANENLQVESLGDLAGLLNKPIRTLQNWVTRGLPRREVSPRKFVYNLRSVSGWILQNIEGVVPELEEADPSFKWRLKYACSANEVINLQRILSNLPGAIKSAFASSGDKSPQGVSIILNWLDKQSKSYEKEKLQDLQKALTSYDKYLAEEEKESE